MILTWPSISNRLQGKRKSKKPKHNVKFVSQVKAEIFKMLYFSLTQEKQAGNIIEVFKWNNNSVPKIIFGFRQNLIKTNLIKFCNCFSKN
jgi:hypothetical protein